ncbi:MAG TPA: hypothetical protein EYH57_01045 [Sulfurovum sp.]|nr:hypothetical protein [Sulfurovum sp.]
MKKIILLLMTVTMFVSADLSVDQIEKMVYKIHEKREGVDLATLNDTKEPFIVGENNETFVEAIKKEEKKDAKLVLHSIVNGKAYINDSWASLNDSILGYTLKFIGKRGVVLRNGNHIKKLYLRKKRDDFIKLEER